MVVLQVLPFSNVCPQSSLQTQPQGLSSSSETPRVMPAATSVVYRPPPIDVAQSMGRKRKRQSDAFSEDENMTKEKPVKKKAATLTQQVFGQNMFKSYVKSALDELDKVWIKPISIQFSCH